MQTVKKKILFCDKPSIKLMITWSYAYKKARCGYNCIEMACDRERFKLRISEASEIINPIILKKYDEFVKNKEK